MEQNKRECPRIATNIKITIQNSGTPVISHIVNLSSGGIFVKTDNPLPIDSTLSLRFHLPGDLEPVHSEGLVVWIKQTGNLFPTGMGIEFTKISPLHKQKIHAFVESQI